MQSIYCNHQRRFYRDASVWCYEHNRFEELLIWLKHNSIEEFYAIVDTITPKILTKRLGNIEFAILLEEGLICPDTTLPKIMRDIISSIIDKLLEEECIYRIPKYI